MDPAVAVARAEEALRVVVESGQRAERELRAGRAAEGASAAEEAQLAALEAAEVLTGLAEWRAMGGFLL